MCGILGAVGPALPAVDETVLQSLAHRGPDGRGLVRLQGPDGRPALLGHTRLAIQDLSPAGAQPMASRDGHWWLVFNGEIYNHLDLRRELQAQGVTDWRGHSDTETLVEAIAHWGLAATLPRLNGMFAFAAWHGPSGDLHLARDRHGIKPLYLAQRDGGLVFGSELRALKALGALAPHPGAPDAQALAAYLTLLFVPAPLCLHAGVRRVGPGEWLSLPGQGGPALSSRFVLGDASPPFAGTREEALARYETLLRQAVKRQLLADTPVALLLSGGIDSALLAAMARDEGHPLPCLSIGFGAEFPECELADARHTAATLGLPIEELRTSAAELLALLPRVCADVEEPLGTPSVLPMSLLMQAARRRAPVVLTGQGSDEPWGGYRKFQAELMFGAAPWPALWGAAAALAVPLGGRGRAGGLARALRGLSHREVERRWLEASAPIAAAQRQRLGGAAQAGAEAQLLALAQAWLARDDARARGDVERWLQLDLRLNLADNLLLYGDKISMAHSVEARVPMLDHVLMDFVESLPRDWRLGWRRGKILHKALAERYLPAAIVHRPKKGFRIPFGRWIREDWRPHVEAVLLDAGAPHFQVLERATVQQLWRQHLAGQDRERELFALLSLAHWWAAAS